MAAHYYFESLQNDTKHKIQVWWEMENGGPVYEGERPYFGRDRRQRQITEFGPNKQILSPGMSTMEHRFTLVGFSIRHVICVKPVDVDWGASKVCKPMMKPQRPKLDPSFPEDTAPKGQMHINVKASDFIHSYFTAVDMRPAYTLENMNESFPALPSLPPLITDATEEDANNMQITAVDWEKELAAPALYHGRAKVDYDYRAPRQPSPESGAKFLGWSQIRRGYGKNFLPDEKEPNRYPGAPDPGGVPLPIPDNLASSPSAWEPGGNRVECCIPGVLIFALASFTLALIFLKKFGSFKRLVWRSRSSR